MASNFDLQKPMRVLIVGAGIAGLTLANALIQHGIRPVVAEIAPELLPKGFGLKLWPSAVRALAAIGLDRQVAAQAVIQTHEYFTDANETTVTAIDLRKESEEIGPHLGIYRNALLEALMAGIGGDADFLLGMTVVDVEQQHRGVSVRLSDGTTERFDLVVGADGLNSRVRELVFRSSKPRFCNFHAWRTVVPLQPVDEKNPVLRSMKGRSMGTFAVSDDLLYLFVLSHGSIARNLSPQRHVELLQEASQVFGGTAPAIVQRISDPEAVFFAPVYEVEQAHWFARRVVLIGDAAHAMVPSYAQGAAMAIEDAVVLAKLLEDVHPVQAALEQYEWVRQSRVQEVYAIVRALSFINEMQGPISEEEMGPHRQLVQDRMWVRRTLLGSPDVYAGMSSSSTAS